MTAALAVRDWFSLAACRRADPEIFFPDDSAGERQALSFCSGCPVRPECLAYALDNGIADGIWGGLTGEERQASGLAAPAEPALCASGGHLRSDAGVSSDGKCRACKKREDWRRRNGSVGRGRTAEPREKDGRGRFARSEAA